VRGEAEGKIGKCPKCGVRFQIALPQQGPRQQAPPAAESAQKIEAPPLQPPPQAPPQRAPAAVTPPVVPTPTESLSDSDWQRGMSDEVLREIEADNARLARQGTISVGVLIFASLVAGAAICFQVSRYGGHEHWVIKRSVAAWLVGMMTAGAMLVSSAHRSGALRFLAAVTAAAAVIAGKLVAAPVISYQPIDALFVVLAIAGCAFTFILAEPSGAHSSNAAKVPAPSPT
jgi:hypothetical protein